MHANHYPVWISNRKKWDRHIFDYFGINNISSSKLSDKEVRCKLAVWLGEVADVQFLQTRCGGLWI